MTTTTAAHTASLPPPARSRGAVTTMVAACLALFAIFLDNTVVNVALPTIQADLAATPERLEWIVNAYVVAFAGLVLLGGSLGDRFGRRHVFRLALVGFALASALGAMATTDGMLIAARALQGAAAAALAPLSLSLLAEAFPRDRLPAAVGMWAGVSGLGLAVGPLVGGLAVAWFGWHSIFWINVPIALAAAACARTASSRVVGRPVDAVGSILATAALVCLVTGLSLTVRPPWTGPTVLVLLSAGAVLAGGFVVHRRRAEFPLVSGSALNPGRFRSAGAAVALTSFGLFGTLWYLSLYLQNIAGYTPVEAGLRTLPLTVTTLVVAPLAGKLSARRGPGPVLAAGLLLAVAALIGLARLDAAASYPFLAGCLLVYGVGLALSLPTAVGVMVADADTERVGTASAVATMTRQLGGALGLAVLATIGARTAASAAHLPPEAAAAPGVGDLIAGARIDIIARLAGEPARVAAADAFLHGFRVVMVVAAAITGLALLAALPLLHWPGGIRAPATGGQTPGYRSVGARVISGSAWVAAWAAVLAAVVYALWALSEAAQTLLAWFGQGPGTHRAAPPLFALHAAAGGIALAAGALQLRLLRRTPKGSRPRHPRLHRTLGRVYIYTAWITGVAGLAVAARFNVGPTAKAAFALEGGLWLLATTLGYLSARRRDLPVHRAWMIRSYALALFIVTFSLLQPLITGAGLSRTATYTLLILISVSANLAGAEALVRRLNRRTTARDIRPSTTTRTRATF